MLDFAWSEIAVIAVIALVVIGPKDLPRVLRTAGMWAARARAIAREFQSSLDQMIREAELDEVKKQVEQAASLDLGQEIQNTIDPGNELQKSLSEPLLAENAPPKPPENPPTAPAAESAPAPEAAPAASAPPASDTPAAPPATRS